MWFPWCRAIALLHWTSTNWCIINVQISGFSNMTKMPAYLHTHTHPPSPYRVGQCSMLPDTLGRTDFPRGRSSSIFRRRQRCGYALLWHVMSLPKLSHTNLRQFNQIACDWICRILLDQCTCIANFQLLRGTRSLEAEQNETQMYL